MSRVVFPCRSWFTHHRPSRPRVTSLPVSNRACFKWIHSGRTSVQPNDLTSGCKLRNTFLSTLLPFSNDALHFSPDGHGLDRLLDGEFVHLQSTTTSLGLFLIDQILGYHSRTLP